MGETHRFLDQIKVKESVQGVYLLKHIALLQGRDSRHYLNVILADSSGELEARVWKHAQSFYDQVEKGGFARIEGKVNAFQGRKQMVIEKMCAVAKEEVNLQNYLVKSQRPGELMLSELKELAQKIEDRYLNQLIANILNDAEIARRLCSWQAGKSIHHAYEGGLIEHILSCTQLAVQLSSHYQVNSSYVIAGTILHDLCKIYELTDGLNVDYTEEGKLIGHVVKCLEIIDSFAAQIPSFPHSIKTHLKHIVLSHHGEFAYGSPKIPMTSEAMLVHMIDLMDSKMATFATIKKKDQQVGHWSQYIKHLDRVIYKEELPTAGQESVGSDHQQKAPLKQSLKGLLQDIKIEGDEGQDS